MSSSAQGPARTAVHQRPPSGTTEPTEEERAAAAALLHLIWGLHISRAVYLAAELGIADLLAAGPRTAAELAEATQADEAALYRVLRLLAALGVLTEPEPRSFGLTVLGDRLRSDVPASMRNWAMLADTVGFGAHEPILSAVRTGRTGTEIAYGMTTMAQVRADARRAARFDAAMSERTAAFAPSVAAAYDFAGMHVIADIGGGQGTLLAAILRRHEHLHGILFDVADVAHRGGCVLRDAGVADRCEIVAGDFFAASRKAPTDTSWPTCCTTGMTAASCRSCKPAVAPCDPAAACSSPSASSLTFCPRPCQSCSAT